MQRNLKYTMVALLLTNASFCFTNSAMAEINADKAQKSMPSSELQAALQPKSSPDIQQDDSDDKIVAIIDGKNITNATLNDIGNSLDPNLMRLPDQKRQAAILHLYINMLSLAKGAEQEGLDKTKDYDKMMFLSKQEVLQKLYINKVIMDSITDDDIKKRYEKEIAILPREEEVHARHIIVKTETEAKEIIKRLDKGEDFATIAKSTSTDGSSAVGGDLGYFSHGQMVEPFEKAAFALKIGTYTHQPVQTPFGWHIIKVEDKRMKKVPTLDDMHDALRNLIAVDKYNNLIKQLRSNVTVKITNADVKKRFELLDKKSNDADDADDTTDDQD